jgi:hypothetical protein
MKKASLALMATVFATSAEAFPPHRECHGNAEPIFERQRRVFLDPRPGGLGGFDGLFKSEHDMKQVPGCSPLRDRSRGEQWPDDLRSDRYDAGDQPAPSEGVYAEAWRRDSFTSMRAGTASVGSLRALGHELAAGILSALDCRLRYLDRRDHRDGLP